MSAKNFKGIVSQKPTLFNVVGAVKKLKTIFFVSEQGADIEEATSLSFVTRRAEQIADEPEWRPGKGIKVKDLEFKPEERQARPLAKNKAFKPEGRESKLKIKKATTPKKNLSERVKPRQDAVNVISFNLNF